MKFVVV